MKTHHNRAPVYIRYTLGLLILLVALCLVTPFQAHAAGTVTQLVTRPASGITLLTFSWTGDAANGSVPATASIEGFSGFVFLVITNPGDTSPTPAYDITLIDADGVDIMGGELADRSDSLSENAVPKIPVANGGYVYGWRYVSGVITLTITNQTDAGATGTVQVFIEQ